MQPTNPPRPRRNSLAHKDSEEWIRQCTEKSASRHVLEDLKELEMFIEDSILHTLSFFRPLIPKSLTQFSYSGLALLGPRVQMTDLISPAFVSSEKEIVLHVSSAILYMAQLRLPRILFMQQTFRFWNDEEQGELETQTAKPIDTIYAFSEKIRIALHLMTSA